MLSPLADRSPLTSRPSNLTSAILALTSDLVFERRTRADHGRGPFAHRTYCTAVHAPRRAKLCRGKLWRTVGANGLSLEHVKWLPAPSALPEIANRRRGFARRAGKPGAAR